MDVAPELARKRIARRQIESEIERTWEDAVRRAEGNDLANGEVVRRRLVKPNVVVEIVEVLICVSVQE